MKRAAQAARAMHGAPRAGQGGSKNTAAADQAAAASPTPPPSSRRSWRSGPLKASTARSASQQHPAARPPARRAATGRRCSSPRSSRAAPPRNRGARARARRCRPRLLPARARRRGAARSRCATRARCATRRRSEPWPRWLANVDTDEVLARAPRATPARRRRRAAHGSSLCVVFRHNSARRARGVANASSALVVGVALPLARALSAAGAAQGSPLAADAGGALSQPAHPKWLLNIDEAIARRATHADSPDLVAVNQHAILNAAGCASCIAGRRAHNQTELPFLQSMLLAALAPRALGARRVQRDGATRQCDGRVRGGRRRRLRLPVPAERLRGAVPSLRRRRSSERCQLPPAAAAALGGGGRAAPAGVYPATRRRRRSGFTILAGGIRAVEPALRRRLRKVYRRVPTRLR